MSIDSRHSPSQLEQEFFLFQPYSIPPTLIGDICFPINIGENIEYSGLSVSQNFSIHSASYEASGI